MWPEAVTKYAWGASRLWCIKIPYMSYNYVLIQSLFGLICLLFAFQRLFNGVKWSDYGYA